MKKFDELYQSILNEDTIFVQNICDVYQKANDILYQTNNVLPCPKHLFEIVKEKVLNLVKTNDRSVQKIDLKEALNDAFIKDQDDSNLVKILSSLFENHNDAFFNVRIEGSSDYYFDKKGDFVLPKGFTENLIDTSTLHYSYPRIRPLILDKNITQNFVKDYKNDVKSLKTVYEKQQKALEIFRKNILNFNDFGTIVIYPWNCTLDQYDIDKVTLDEAIQHECQHLCIFLLSLAKTCIHVGLHFSNNIKNAAFSYQLKASEFITLTGSYCNILVRIYKKIQQPKNINEFIKTLLDLSIYEKTNNDEKYIKALYSSQQFSRIKEFYREIWKDSKYGFYQKKFQNDKLVQAPLIKIDPNKKFQKLITWTVKNIQKELEK